MKNTKKIKVRNFVAKHSQHTGAGQHKQKFGKFISRARSKHLSQKVEL